MKTSRFQYFLFVILLTSTLVACGGGDSSPRTPPPGTPDNTGTLISVTAINSPFPYTVNNILSSIDSYINDFGFDLNDIDTANIVYPVQVYRVVYTTIDAKGNEVRASGILALPDNDTVNRPSILSYQHGTIFNNQRVPSSELFYQDTSAIFAGMNNIVVMPDYVGYGESVDSIHPYMHANKLAKSTVDLLRAVKTYLADEEITTDGNLFLAGYSEGGFATVATHKMIQEQYSDEFTVTASIPGAGAYDLGTTARLALQNEVSMSFATAVYLYYAYEAIYGYNRLSTVLTTHSVDGLSNFDGSVNDGTVYSYFTGLTSEIYQPDFLTDFRSDDGELTLKQHIDENNIYDWTPTSPISFFHGDEDTTTPYFNSVTALNTMRDNGATGLVTLTDCQATPADHTECSAPYFGFISTELQSLK